jgi:hypothetical protein
MRQSTLPFIKEQETPERDDQFRMTKRPKVLANQLKDNSVEEISEYSSTPDKEETKRGGKAQAKRDAKGSKNK